LGAPGKIRPDCAGEKPHGAKKPGFYESLGWVTRNIERNPVSEIFAWGEKPGFFPYLRL